MMDVRPAPRNSSTVEPEHRRMTIRLWATLTWEDVRALDRPRTVAILPVGAVEAHGPHLPLATDSVIAMAMARAGAERFAAAGREVVILPALAYAAAPFAAGFPGTIPVSAETVTALVVDVARALTKQGFAALAIANAHLDPAHLASLGAACAAAAAESLLPVAWPDLTRKPWATRLGEEFASGACHAGSFEGSIVMAEMPEAVREDVRVGLPANGHSLSEAIRAGKTTFEEAGGPRAYFGRPADATAEEGEETVDVLGAILAESVEAALAAAGKQA
jgi:creatinine amidohydrolase